MTEQFNQKADQLEEVVSNYDLEAAREIAENYRKFAIRQRTVLGDVLGQQLTDVNLEETGGDVNVYVDTITSDDFNNFTEEVQKDYITKLRTTLIAHLEEAAEPARPDTSRTVVRQRTGFAAAYERVNTNQIFKDLSPTEKMILLKKVVEVAGNDVPEEVKVKVEQVIHILHALEAVRDDIQYSMTWAEGMTQTWTEFAWETKKRLKDVQAMIDFLTSDATKNKLFMSGKSIQDVLATSRQGQRIFEFLKENKLDEFVGRTGFKEREKLKQLDPAKLQLLKFQIAHRGYAAAHLLLDEIFKAELEKGKEMINEGDRVKIAYQAQIKFKERVNPAVVAEWKRNKILPGGVRQPGMTDAQVEEHKALVKKAITERLTNEYIAQHLMAEDIEISAEKMPFWEEWNDLSDPKGELLNLSAENWDFILDTFIKEAPLIAISGVVGLGVAKGCVRVYNAVKAVEAIKKSGMAVRLTSIATKYPWAAKAAGQVGQFGVNGLYFEMTNMKLHGQNLFELPMEEWVAKAAVSAMTLGAFHGVALLTPVVANIKAIDSVIKFISRGNPTAAKFAEYFVVTGNLQAATIMIVNSLHHLDADTLKVFWANFGQETWKALVTTYALGVSNGVVTGTFSGGRKVVGKIARVKSEAREVNPNTALEKGIESGKVDIKSHRELTTLLEIFRRDGYEIELTDRGVKAKKGGKEVEVVESEALRRASERIKVEIAKAGQLNPNSPSFALKINKLGLRIQRILVEAGIKLTESVRIAKLFVISLVFTATGCTEALKEFIGPEWPLLLKLVGFIGRHPFSLGSLAGITVLLVTQRKAIANARKKSRAAEARDTANLEIAGLGQTPSKADVEGVIATLRDMFSKMEKYPEIANRVAQFEVELIRIARSLNEAKPQELNVAIRDALDALVILKGQLSRLDLDGIALGAIINGGKDGIEKLTSILRSNKKKALAVAAAVAIWAYFDEIVGAFEKEKNPAVLHENISNPPECIRESEAYNADVCNQKQRALIRANVKQ